MHSLLNQMCSGNSAHKRRQVVKNKQACAVDLFVVMSLKNFLIDEHGWTSAFLSQTCFSKSLLTGNLCCSSLANYIIRVLLQKVWHCISQRVCPLNNIAVHLGFVSALFKHVV